MEEDYEVHQLVFAKVRGYPRWPAQIIERVSNSRYRLIYYGTDENGVVAYKDLHPYNDETKKKFVTKKLLERKDFRFAVQQAETDLIAVGEEPQENQVIESEEVAAFRIKKIRVLNNPLKMNELRIQQAMIVTAETIRSCLANYTEKRFDEALRHVLYFKNDLLPFVTRVVLFKYPLLSETFVMLIRFFTPANASQIVRDHVEEIKSLSAEICQQFKMFYGQQDDSPFVRLLDEREAKIEAKLETLSREDLFEATTMDELEAFINAGGSD